MEKNYTTDTLLIRKLMSDFIDIRHFILEKKKYY